MLGKNSNRCAAECKDGVEEDEIFQSLNQHDLPSAYLRFF
jgi:hypothetical protein